MNKALFHVCATIALTFSCLPAFAQMSANANVSATITTPVTVSKESDLEIEHVALGSILANANGQLSPARKAQQRAVSNAAPKMIQASFSVTGNPEYAYNISVPSYITVTTAHHVLTIGTESCSANGSQMLSKQGLDSVAVDGVILSRKPAAELVASNTEGINELPVTFNNY